VVFTRLIHCTMFKIRFVLILYSRCVFVRGVSRCLFGWLVEFCVSNFSHALDMIVVMPGF